MTIRPEVVPIVKRMNKTQNRTVFSMSFQSFDDDGGALRVTSTCTTGGPPRRGIGGGAVVSRRGDETTTKKRPQDSQAQTRPKS